MKYVFLGCCSLMLVIYWFCIYIHPAKGIQRYYGKLNDRHVLFVLKKYINKSRIYKFLKQIYLLFSQCSFISGHLWKATKSSSSLSLGNRFTRSLGGKFDVELHFLHLCWHCLLPVITDYFCLLKSHNNYLGLMLVWTLVQYAFISHQCIMWL